MNITNNIRYMPQLDGLRAIAILGVLPVHFLSHSDIWLHAYIDTGDLGVKLFFVLSGFLIGSTLLTARGKIEAGKNSIKSTLVNFYIRRSLRLFPLYYLYLLLSFFLIPGVREYIFWFLTYTQNILFSNHMEVFSSFLGHLWTLAIEEQFYLIAPIIILIAPSRYLLNILISLVWGALIFRLLNNEGFLLPAQMDVLVMGVIAALITNSTQYNRYVNISKKYSLIIGLLITLLCVFFRVTNSYESVVLSISNTGLGLLFYWLILSAASGFKGYTKTLLEFKPLMFLGKISYGVYLLHFNVPGLLRDIILPKLGWVLPSNPAYNFFIFTIVSVMIATASWYMFERPILSLKNRFKI